MPDTEWTTPNQIRTSEDLPYAKRYIASLDPFLSGWEGGPRRVFFVFCCTDPEGDIVRKNLLNAGYGIDRDTSDRGTFDEKLANRMVDSFPGSIIPGIIACITPMNSLWAVVNWPGNMGVLIPKPSRWYEYGAFPKPDRSWRHCPAKEGPFETGCWTEEGNDLVLFMQNDSRFHPLIGHVFKNAKRSVFRMWGQLRTRPDTELSVLMPTLLSSGMYRMVRELYKRANDAFQQECNGHWNGRVRINEETFLDFHQWMIRWYPVWFTERELEKVKA